MVEHCPEEEERVFRSGVKVRGLSQFPKRKLAVPLKIKKKKNKKTKQKKRSEVDKIDKL